MSTPRIGIIIVCYNGVVDTRECLESLRNLTYPKFFTVVVDNASSDNTAEVVRSEFPEVTLIVSPQNTGFTGGNQTGVRVAFDQGAEFIFLLNPDTIVVPDLLECLMKTWEAQPNLGALGPLMLLYDEPEIVWSAGGELDARGQVRHLLQGEPAPTNMVYQPCKFVSGCGLLFSRAIFEQVGFFDERFFLYYEESDLCARIRKAGYEIGTAFQARLWHKVSRVTGKDSPLTLYYMRRNQLLYLQKHGTRAGQLAGLLDTFRLLVVWTLKRNPKRTVLLRALRDFQAGRFGRADGI
ncbi:glycosyltransferase family 2 protein [Armatimonas sp.]|uniref:glycosyltransferase family 2 protein n=1 Tax=Armatimonas sp. TaxID=1872638 RepID=UPI00286C8026|nr:glycosyltransferase family 2 protein [Armatimonas sp.]